jgi:hypothetical protein
MLKIYFPLPNGKSFAFVARCGTTSLSESCLRTFYPNIYNQFLTINDRENGGYAWRMLPKQEKELLPPNCVVVVREPIARFASLCSRSNTKPEFAIKQLSSIFVDKHIPTPSVSHGWINHFRPISTIIQQDSIIKRLDQLEEVGILLGCDIPRKINTIVASKLSDDIIPLVSKIYEEDIALWKTL